MVYTETVTIKASSNKTPMCFTAFEVICSFGSQDKYLQMHIISSSRHSLRHIPMQNALVTLLISLTCIWYRLDIQLLHFNIYRNSKSTTDKKDTIWIFIILTFLSYYYKGLHSIHGSKNCQPKLSSLSNPHTIGHLRWCWKTLIKVFGQNVKISS